MVQVKRAPNFPLLTIGARTLLGDQGNFNGIKLTQHKHIDFLRLRHKLSMKPRGSLKNDRLARVVAQ